MIDTNLFNFDEAATSAAWIREFEDWSNEVDSDEIDDDDDEEEDHHHHEHHHEHEEEHHHHHHHHHENGVDENDDEGTADEYDINTFVYYRRRPFNKVKFIDWAENNGRNIIRAKGILYFEQEKQNAYVYESAGRQRTLTLSGKWYSETLSKRQIKMLIENDENFAHDWDEKYGDKLIKLVFIGQNLDKVGIKKELDLI